MKKRKKEQPFRTLIAEQLYPGDGRSQAWLELKRLRSTGFSKAYMGTRGIWASRIYRLPARLELKNIMRRF